MPANRRCSMRWSARRSRIISHKVQTTRALIRGIAIEGQSQLIFVDTPGIFSPRRRLDRAMVTTAWSGAHEADLVGVLIDARKGLDEEAEDILRRLGDVKAPKLLVLNKIDLVAKEALLSLANAANKAAKFESTFMISALTGDGVADLKTWLAAARAAGAVALSARPDVGRADAPARGRDHTRKAVRAAAPGTAVPLDGGDRGLEGTARGRHPHRADDLRRARKPAQDRARQRRADHQGDRRGRAQGDCRHRRSQGAPVPVRESARGLGRRSGTLPRNGTGVPEGVTGSSWLAMFSPSSCPALCRASTS